MTLLLFSGIIWIGCKVFDIPQNLKAKLKQIPSGVLQEDKWNRFSSRQWYKRWLKLLLK